MQVSRVLPSMGKLGCAKRHSLPWRVVDARNERKGASQWAVSRCKDAVVGVRAGGDEVAPRRRCIVYIEGRRSGSSRELYLEAPLARLNIAVATKAAVHCTDCEWMRACYSLDSPVDMRAYRRFVGTLFEFEKRHAEHGMEWVKVWKGFNGYELHRPSISSSRNLSTLGIAAQQSVNLLRARQPTPGSWP